MIRAKASLELNFEFDRSAGHTVLRSGKQQPPLRVLRAFPLEDRAALVHLHNVSGGLLAGDQLDLMVNVAPGAAAQLTTTGATRVYRALDGYADTTQVNRINVGENGLLEFVPDPLIPFAGARFGQTTSIQLAAGAGLFWWDMVAPGREARGELFAFERIEVGTNLLALGRSIACERMRIEPGKRRPASPARLGCYRYWATFYICRVGVGPKVWLEAEQHLRSVARNLRFPEDALWGMSTLPAHGLIVRGLSIRGPDLVAGVRAIWQAAKLLVFDSKVILPRKVN